MSLWTERILSHFTVDLTRLWVACDPDDVLLDEKLLTELRSRGFELMLYEDPFAFRAEYEERYRAAWDSGEQGPAPSLVLHLRRADANALPWDIVHHGRVVRLSLAEIFPRLAYSAVQQVEPEHFAGSKSSRSILPGCFMPTRPNCSLRGARANRRTSSSNTSTSLRPGLSVPRWTSGASCCGCTLPTARCHRCSPSTRQASSRARDYSQTCPSPPG